MYLSYETLMLLLALAFLAGALARPVRSAVRGAIRAHRAARRAAAPIRKRRRRKASTL